MGEWKITVQNLTGEGGHPGKQVEFMLFQTRPDPLTLGSYSSAWKVATVQYPGHIGPAILPTAVTFYVIDKVDGLLRETGPFDVKFGQQIEVTQKKAADAPKVTISGTPQPHGEIKTTNVPGNAQSLEFALFKDGKKIVSYKGVPPADAVYLDIKPSLYIADILGSSIKEGDDFKAGVQAAKSTQFKLHPDIPTVKIGIKQKTSGEIDFIQL